MKKVLINLFGLVLCFAVIAEASDLIIIHEPISSDVIETTKPADENPVILDVPANDDCENAEPIGEVTDMEFSTQEATFDGPGVLITASNIWYIYTATNTCAIDVRTCSQDETLTLNSRLAVYDGTSCFTQSETPVTVELQGGEDMESAADITQSLPVCCHGSLLGYAHDYTLSCSYYENPDVVYSYTPESDDSLNIFLCADTDQGENVDFCLGVLDADGYELVCAADDFPDDNPAILNFPVTAGETYYFVVTNVYYGGSYYFLTITSPEYKLLDADDGACVGGSRVGFDAVAGNQYLIEVGGESGDTDSAGTGVISVSQLPDTPENDDCENATDGGILIQGSSLEFTGYVTSSTTDCDLLGGPSVWIKFTTEETMDIILDFCGSPSAFNYLCGAIFRNCPCDADYLLYDNDDWENPMLCPLSSNHMRWVNLSAGTYYYAILYNPGFSEGDYVVNVHGLEPQFCEDDYLLYGHSPSVWEYYTGTLLTKVSEWESGKILADDFSDVTGKIDKITLWGSAYNPTSGEQSFPDEYALKIAFCKDNGGLPGDTAAVYNAVASCEMTGDVTLTRKQIKFEVTIDPPLDTEEASLTETGWLLVEGDEQPDDWFRWQTSANDGNYASYNQDDGYWVQANLPTDLAFCLYGENTNDINDEIAGIPAVFELSGNYPNPFNATTSINFSLSQSDEVSLTIYDVGGRLIKSLYTGTLSAGPHSVVWNGTNESGDVVSSGVYFYRLNSSEGTLSKSMVLLK